MKTALVVLGMHRSGTSSVAGALVQVGGKAPKTLMPPADQNPRGFFESLPVTQLNDVLMAERGVSWSDWRPRSFGIGPSADQRIVDLIGVEFGGSDGIVLKDPRLCRIFLEWRLALAAADYTPRIVMPIRNPSEVAASLGQRDNFSRSYGLRLWLRNVLDAEVSSRGLARHTMRWSDFLHDWRQQLEIMNTRLGTSLFPDDAEIAAAIDEFLCQDLHRQRSNDPLPSLVAETWELLTELAVVGERADLAGRFDDLRQTFDRTADLFDDFN